MSDPNSPVFCVTHNTRYPRGKGCPECRSAPTLTPEEAAKEAVIEAAEKYYLGADYSTSVPRLNTAVQTLLAIRQPKGVKPEEVPLGGRFRMVFESGDISEIVCRKISGSEFVEEPNIYKFLMRQTVIPIDPEEGEGCGHVCHLEGNALGRAYCPKCGEGLTEPIDPEDS